MLSVLPSVIRTWRPEAAIPCFFRTSSTTRRVPDPGSRMIRGDMGELREGEAFPRGGGMRTARQNDFILHEGQVMQVRAPCGAFHDAELHGFILHGLFRCCSGVSEVDL